MADQNDTTTTTDAPAPRPSRRRVRRAWSIAGFVALLLVAALVAQLAGTSTPAPRPGKPVGQLLGRPVPTRDSTRVATTTLTLTKGKGVRLRGSATLTKTRQRGTANVACAVAGSRDADKGWTPIERPETLGRDPRQQMTTLSGRHWKKTLRFDTVVVAPADDTYRLHIACGVTNGASKVTATGHIATNPVSA